MKKINKLDDLKDIRAKTLAASYKLQPENILPHYNNFLKGIQLEKELAAAAVISYELSIEDTIKLPTENLKIFGFNFTRYAVLKREKTKDFYEQLAGTYVGILRNNFGHMN